MEELDARLELLMQELSQLQEAIRAQGQSMTSVKGWAVTVGVASAGLALSADAAAVTLLVARVVSL